MEKEFSPQESLELIRSMIARTKSNLEENRFYFLFWGWTAFLAILIQFFLKVVFAYRHHYLVWLVIIPAGIYTVIYSRRHSRDTGARTYVSTSMSYLWTGMGISFFVLSMIINRLPGTWLHAWPFFILFYGLGTFVSGMIIQFRPLVAGGIINWVLALGCLFVSYDYQMLFAAAAIFTSYIIPGHLLKSKEPV